MIQPQEAWSRIDSYLHPLAAQPFARQDAVGLVLADALVATVDMPPADVSAMDGYALAGRPAAGPPVSEPPDRRPPDRWPVVAVAAAGAPVDRVLFPGEAAKIMTGAVVPAGADRVVPVELSDGGTEQVSFERLTDPGAHIRRQGEVIRRGDALFAPGTLLTPGAISLLASHGIGTVSMHRPPRVAVLSTGDEVVPPDQEPGPGQLRDSNSAFLLAAGRTLGLDFEPLGIAPDERQELKRRIEQGLERDVTLLCGGVSMGDYDFVEEVLADLGCELLFDKVAIQPGKPLVVARRPRDGRWICGLPGNPASVMVTFWLFVRPLLRRLMGLADGYWQGALAATLAAPLPGAKARDRFLPAAIGFERGRIHAQPAAPRGSHDVATYGVGSALVKIPALSEPAVAGAPCEILPLADWRVGSAQHGEKRS